MEKGLQSRMFSWILNACRQMLIFIPWLSHVFCYSFDIFELSFLEWGVLWKPLLVYTFLNSCLDYFMWSSCDESPTDSIRPPPFKGSVTRDSVCVRRINVLFLRIFSFENAFFVTCCVFLRIFSGNQSSKFQERIGMLLCLWWLK